MPCADRIIQERIVRETVSNARFLLEACGSSGEVETVFIGGGTPSILSLRDFRALLDGLRATAVPEWTVEANPESLNRRFLEACAERGVTRISMGMQTCNAALLAMLGRPGRNADNLRALELLQKYWAGEVNLDFLAGIPGQNDTDLEAGLSLAVEAGIGHVSLYSLTVEPDTALSRLIAEGKICPDSVEYAEGLWFHGKELLEEAGYAHYEISNFAKPGKECRHNMRYWRLEPYIGAGPGAVSTLPASLLSDADERKGDGIRNANVVRLSNPRDLESFLSGRKGLWGLESEAVSDESFLLETLMMGLRTSEGISTGLFSRRFGGGFDAFFPGRRERWIMDGLAYDDAQSLRLTEKGRLRLDGLLRGIAGDIAGGLPAGIMLQWP